MQRKCLEKLKMNASCLYSKKASLVNLKRFKGSGKYRLNYEKIIFTYFYCSGIKGLKFYKLNKPALRLSWPPKELVGLVHLCQILDTGNYDRSNWELREKDTERKTKEKYLELITVLITVLITNITRKIKWNKWRQCPQILRFYSLVRKALFCKRS